MASSIIYGLVTINFPVETIFNDTVQLVLNIDWSSGSDSQTYTSEELGLSVKSRGEIALEYELDQFVLTPADISIILNDANGILADYLFGVDFNDMTVQAEIKINGVSDFNGSLVDDSLRNNEGDKSISMAFSSDSNKANEVTLYSAGDVALNPLGYDLTAYSSITNNQSVLLTFEDAITDILQLVDPDIDVDFQHDWLFGGITTTNRPYVFSSLRVCPRNWYNEPTQERLLGDLLKTIAKTFFAQIAIPSNSKAFFRKLYYYSSSNTQTVNVLNRIRGYKYHKIKYANSKNTFGTLDGAIISESPNSSSYTEVIEDYVSYSHTWDSYYVYTETASKFENAVYVKDPLYADDTQTYYNWIELISKLMYYYRSKTYYNRVDSFKMKGLDYDYTKNFNYDGSKYQILSMRKYLDKGYSEIDALYLGEQ